MLLGSNFVALINLTKYHSIYNFFKGREKWDLIPHKGDISDY